jgi:hypothetical protein
MIVRLQGGLGNQMFGAAFGFSVAMCREEPIFFTRDRVDADPKRCYCLGVFDLPIKFCDPSGAPIYTEDPYSFNPHAYTVPNGTYFIGQWQTEKYFNTLLVLDYFKPKVFSESCRNTVERINKLHGHSAFIHVRRSDYIEGPNPDYHLTLGMTYYNEGIDRIRKMDKDVQFFVFSDDRQWCKETFPEFTVVDCTKPGGRYFGSDQPGNEHEDIWLMSLCRHGIIANSSFSWWGAWLGDVQDNRIIIAPSRWFGPQFAYLDTKDIIPERWTKI